MTLFSLSLNILTYCGCWRPESWSSSYKKNVYYVHTVVTSFFVHGCMISQVIDLILCFDNSKDFADNAYMTLPVFLSSCKIYSVITNRERIRKLMDILMTPPCRANDEEEKKIHDKYNKKYQRNTKLYLYPVLFSFMCNILGTLIMDLGKRRLAYRSWLPFEYKSTNLFYVVFVHQLIGGAISASCQVASDTLICGFILQICSQIELLEYRVKIITEGSNLSLHTCVYHHEFIYRISAMVNDTFKFVMCCQFSTSTFLVCFNLYRMAKEPFSAYFVQLSIYMFVVLGQVFYLCYNGNELKFKSNEIVNTVFGMDWPSVDVNTQRSLLMIMKRAMKPIEFVCAFVINVDLNSFVGVVKTSYSVYNLLQQTTEQ